MLDALRAVLRRPSKSLPSRLTFFVFAATFLTALVVTWMSIRSIQEFLRIKVDQKYPAILLASAERIDLWYAQRALDIQTFARSDTVGRNPIRGGVGPEASRTRSETDTYLQYVLESFPQYEALVLLDREGRTLHAVGRSIELPDPVRHGLAKTSTSRVRDFVLASGERVQIASAPVGGPAGSASASLHAFLRLDALAELLHSEGLGREGRLFVVDGQGAFVHVTPELRARGPYAHVLPEPESVPVVKDYRVESGERFVGSALRLPRFGWTLVVEQPYAEAFLPVAKVVRRVLGINLAIVSGLSLVALAIAVSIVRPIKALSSGARRIAEGETDVVVMEPSSLDEIGLLTRTFNKMAARLHRNRLELQQNRLEIEAANSRLRAQNEELQRLNEMLQKLSITDPLTRLANHRFLHEQLRRETSRAERAGDPLALLLIDVDGFKRLNDRLGHAAGDRLLQEIADRMRGVARESDVLARYSGEEFALLAPATHGEVAAELAERLRLATGEIVPETDAEAAATDLRITLSIGVCAGRGTAEELLERTEQALTRAKEAGGDCVVIDGVPEEESSATD